MKERESISGECSANRKKKKKKGNLYLFSLANALPQLHSLKMILLLLLLFTQIKLRLRQT